MTGIVEKIVELHGALGALPHAFGGALALAWCTEQARGTIDIDVNVFVPVAQLEQVLAALPAEVVATPEQIELLRRDGQVRLFWDRTPVDLFLNTTPFHDAVALRVRHESFAGTDVRFLGCTDLAVFKAFFDRTKDWADLEAMAAAGTLDLAAVIGELVLHLGADDPRITRLRALAPS